MVKVNVVKTYETSDGVKHASKEAAEAHERGDFLKQFANLKLPLIEEVFAGETDKAKSLGKSFERLGALLREQRFARGDKAFRGKRKKKKAAEPVPEQAPAAEPAHAHAAEPAHAHAAEPAHAHAAE